jgi:hypothetical protein
MLLSVCIVQGTRVGLQRGMMADRAYPQIDRIYPPQSIEHTPQSIEHTLSTAHLITR